MFKYRISTNLKL